MGKIIAIVNQKGGVGKTTTTLNLGYALAERDKKVLMIDFDPQSSLTVCMGYDDTDAIPCTIATLMQCVMEDDDLPEDYQYIYHHVGKNGIALDFIPCSMELSAIDVSLVNAVCRESILKGILTNLISDYDYIIIDCSPSLGMLTINALVAAQSIIIPVTPEYLSAKGLEILLKNILRVKRKINPGLDVEGILFTMYKDRMRLTQTVDEIVCQTYGNAVPIYNTKIPYSIKVGESNLQSQSIIQYAKSNKVAYAYRMLAEEVLKNE